ncbi:MAG: hypothetical protein KDD41_00800 [Flavobacteriales bacterium]|nr:hypothetical protein [Flavobacteriales bacterium]
MGTIRKMARFVLGKPLRYLSKYKPLPKADYTYREFCRRLSETDATFMKYNELNYHRLNPYPFEPEASKIEGKKVVFIRHDIDHNPFVALELAKVEAEFGLFGSYYMLTTDTDITKIWDSKQKESLKALKQIQDLGHEVGLHYDLLGDYFETGNDVSIKLAETLKAFRDSGINVSGCVAHGSGRLSQYLAKQGISQYPRECINFNIWEESNEKPATVNLNGREKKTPFLKLADFGMRYEAYKVRRNYYHSDNKYVFWQHGDPIDTITNKMKPEEILCILVHPYVWRKNMK